MNRTEEGEVLRVAAALLNVADALREVHALGQESVADPAFDASMMGQIAACEEGRALLLRRATQPDAASREALEAIERLSQPWGGSPTYAETLMRIGERARAALGTDAAGRG